MNINTLTKAQLEMKKFGEINRLNESEPESRPHRNPDEEILSWQLQTVKYEKNDITKTKTLFLSENSHFCSKSFEELEPINLCDMKVPMIHEGKYLVCQVKGKPYSVIGLATPSPYFGVHTLIEDLNGDIEELAMYNFRHKVDDVNWLPLGTILIIKEPWLRYGSQSKTASLRVDSPSDVIFVDPIDNEVLEKIGATKWHDSKLSKNAEVWQKEANECFKKGKYEMALKLYDRAIRFNPELSVLHSNKSLTCLRIGAFYDAYEAAKIGLEKGGNREKALYRMGQAAYDMREWQNAANHFAAILLESEKHEPQFEVADYVGPIEIANIPGKGRGIIASEDIKEGTLLVVSKAFSTSLCQDFLSLLGTIQSFKKQGATADQLLQVTQIMKNLQLNPQLGKEIYDLYAGDLEQNVDIPFGVIDAARVQQISACNTFGTTDVGENSESIDKIRLFVLPSYFNHSCIANGKREFFHDVMVVHATADIKKGEEIFVPYINLTYDFLERKKKLDFWKFTCTCALCELDANDENCLKRNEMVKKYVKFANGSYNLYSIIDQGEALLKKIRETYVNRNELKIVLVQFLDTLYAAYYDTGNKLKCAKILEEIISLMDNPLKYTEKIKTKYLDLAHCYLSLRNNRGYKEMLQKAMKLSFCADMEHFKAIYPMIGRQLSVM
uniref:SET domain-containing protein n=1 Tax=Panagrolaimus superbus TaxID=310955 RepID=A0A914Z667_9BILA